MNLASTSAAMKGADSLTLLVLLLGDWKESLFMILPVHFSLCIIKRLKKMLNKTAQPLQYHKLFCPFKPSDTQALFENPSSSLS